MFSKIRKAVLFVILALLCIYFTISFSSSLNQNSQSELEQSTLRVSEQFKMLTRFAKDTRYMGEYYFNLESPRLDKNFDKIRYSDNFYYSTDERLMDHNRRIYGRGSVFTVMRDSYYINVVYFLDSFFRDFSAGYHGVSSINYYSKHRFVYSYSELGSDYISKIGFYSEKYRAEGVINRISGPDEMIWDIVVNQNYMDQKEIAMSTPIYNNDELEGVVSVNFSIDKINEILDNNFYQTFLIDKNGYIIATNANKDKKLDAFENIRDFNYFGTDRGQKIIDTAFVKGADHNLSRRLYKFSEPLADEYVMFTYVPFYTYFFRVLTNLIAIIVMGKIIFWLNDTYEKRRNVRVELRQKYKEVSRYKDELEEVATTDFLTKLYNRRYLLVRMEEQKQYYKSEPNAKFIVLLMDIDHFKKVNDTYGHQAGDEVLKIVSSTIKENSRKVDLVARWGGEEILVVLVDTDLGTGKTIAERIRTKVEEAVATVDGNDIKVTISIGVQSMYMVGSFDKAITHADEALYKAKSTGRNKVVLYSELNLENELATLPNE